MELESKSTFTPLPFHSNPSPLDPELTQTSLHEDSDPHQPNPDPQFVPGAEDFNHVENNPSPLESTTQPTHSISASMNFDDMPISSKPNLTFEQMIEGIYFYYQIPFQTKPLYSKS